MYMCKVHLEIDFIQVLLKYLKCQSETHLSEENDETICTIEDDEIFSSAENLTLT